MCAGDFDRYITVSPGVAVTQLTVVILAPAENLSCITQAAGVAGVSIDNNPVGVITRSGIVYHLYRCVAVSARIAVTKLTILVVTPAICCAVAAQAAGGVIIGVDLYPVGKAAAYLYRG